jgi:hypothetical protein
MLQEWMDFEDSEEVVESEVAEVTRLISTLDVAPEPEASSRTTVRITKAEARGAAQHALALRMFLQKCKDPDLAPTHAAAIPCVVEGKRGKAVANAPTTMHSAVNEIARLFSLRVAAVQSQIGDHFN